MLPRNTVARTWRPVATLIKLFPHHDAVPHAYYDSYDDSPAEPKAALKRCLPEYSQGKGSNLKGLRSHRRRQLYGSSPERALDPNQAKPSNGIAPKHPRG